MKLVEVVPGTWVNPERVDLVAADPDTRDARGRKTPYMGSVILFGSTRIAVPIVAQKLVEMLGQETD